METILGKITHIRANGGTQYLVSFTPVCLLPGRTMPPSWLGEAELAIVREVSDPRELGGPGDSIVLTPQESARWLRPLSVNPLLTRGGIPDRLRLDLAWWPNASPPEFIVSAGDDEIRGIFSHDGDRFVAEVVVGDRLSLAGLPANLTVSCGALSVDCAVVPAGKPYVHSLASPEGQRFRLENVWCSIDVTRSWGGAILAWHESGREMDHFARPIDRIGLPLEFAGHADSYRTGWTPSERLRTVTMPDAQYFREKHASTVQLWGKVGGAALSTAIECTLYDDLPLLAWQRTYNLRQSRRAEADGARETIDDIRPFGVSFRGAWAVGRNAEKDSRIICADVDGLVIERLMAPHHAYKGSAWWMTQGWTLVEHPLRRACSLYLFPPQPGPRLRAKLTTTSLTLEPEWPLQPARAGDRFTLMLGMTHGECCGAGPNGAWVGSRAPLTDGGLRCVVIARLNNVPTDDVVLFCLGNERQQAGWRFIRLPEVGEVAFATVEFPTGHPDAPLEITVPGLAQRRPV